MAVFYGALNGVRENQTNTYHSKQIGTRPGAVYSIFLWARPHNEFINETFFSTGMINSSGHWLSVAKTGFTRVASFTVDTGSQVGCSSTNSYVHGNWLSIAAVELGTSRLVVANGDWDNRGTEGTTIGEPIGNNLTAIGALRRSSTSNYTWGDVAYVAMWSIALTQVEIEALHKGKSPITIQASSLVNFWSLRGDGPVNERARDLIGGVHLDNVTGLVGEQVREPIKGEALPGIIRNAFMAGCC